MIPETQEEYDRRMDEEGYGTALPQPQNIQVNLYKDFRVLWAEVEVSLLGGRLDYDPITKKYTPKIPKDAKPYMNAHGINDCMAFLRSQVNIITGTSIMDEPRVMLLCEKTGNALLIMLQNNRETYDIGDGKMGLIARSLMNVFEANLRTSINGQGLEWFLQHERVIETRNTTPPQPGLIRKIIG